MKRTTLLPLFFTFFYFIICIDSFGSDSFTAMDKTAFKKHLEINSAETNPASEMIFEENIDYQEVKQTGGALSESAESISLDGNGNIITVGTFEGTVDFDPGTSVFELTSNGLFDIYIQKLSSTGEFLWAKSIGGIEDDYGNAIVTDDSGNIYIVGEFQQTVDFDPNASEELFSSNGWYDVFILKLDSEGNFVWNRQIGGSGFDFGTSIALDGLGSVYTTGIVDGLVDLDPDPEVSNFTVGSSSQDVLILKLNTEGIYVWSATLGGSVFDSGNSISTDFVGNVYITGSFSGTVDLDTGAGVESLTAPGFPEIFLLKLTSSGEFIWAQSYGNADDFDQGYALITDNQQNVYISGEVFSMPFLRKLDANGNLIWNKEIPGSLGFSNNFLSLDSENNIYLISNFQGSLAFDSYNFSSKGGLDALMLKLNPDGDIVLALQIGGTGDDRGNDIIVDEQNNVYVVGSFEETVDFNPNGSSNILSSNGSSDAYILKLSQGQSFLGCNDLEACNYIENVTGSVGCIFPTENCTICNPEWIEGSEADVLLPVDTDNDGICDADELPGCTDPLACNYIPVAEIENNSCIYATGCDVCESGAIIDNPEIGDPCNDNNGSTGSDVYVDCEVCQGVLLGCTDELACNYNVDAVESDGSCNYAAGCDACDGLGGITNNPEVGSPCNDGNPNTINDAYVECLICQGIENSGISLEFVPVYVHPDEFIIDPAFPEGEFNLGGYTTWILYVNLPNMDDYLTAVQGYDNQPLSIAVEGNGEFFQHPVGTTTGPLNDAIFPFTALMQYDSYLTLGQLLESDFTEIQQVIDLEDPEYPWIDSFINGGDIIMDSFIGGAWISLIQTEQTQSGTVISSTQGLAGSDFRVPIGQFTANADITAEVNVLVYPDGINLTGQELDSFTGLVATTATDNCVNCSEPILAGTPEPFVSVNCADEITEAPTVSASSSCNAEIEVTYIEETSGLELDPAASTNCEGVQPLNAFDDWAMILFDLPGATSSQNEYVVESSQVTFFETEENGSEALLTGVFSDKDNPSAAWSVHIPLVAGADWETWSAMPDRTFKDNWNVAGDNYLDWTYFIIQSGGAYMQGIGDLEGSYLEISHAPVTEIVGWQLGDAANNLGTNYGLGGWLSYEGIYTNSSLNINEAISGSGDIALDLNCCTSYGLTRTWSAVNCAGVETNFTQIITILGQELTGAKYCRGDFNFDGYISTGDLSMFLADFTCSSGYCPCDLNDDGFTTSSDLSEFLSLIGNLCE